MSDVLAKAIRDIQRVGKEKLLDVISNMIPLDEVELFSRKLKSRVILNEYDLKLENFLRGSEGAILGFLNKNLPIEKSLYTSHHFASLKGPLANVIADFIHNKPAKSSAKADIYDVVADSILEKRSIANRLLQKRQSDVYIGFGKGISYGYSVSNIIFFLKESDFLCQKRIESIRRGGKHE